MADLTLVFETAWETNRPKEDRERQLFFAAGRAAQPSSEHPFWEAAWDAAQRICGFNLDFDSAKLWEYNFLLRHIIGNPFRPYPAPAHWPAAVIQLAEALYAGEDCGFALHDALVEAGHAELAEHFRHAQWHPKGCWVVDLILGKK
jgi:hypothetical protein